MKLEIWTDGSSRGNPGRGGWAAILIAENQEGRIKNQEGIQNSECEIIELGGRDDMTTNNRMELLATIKGLKEVSRYLLVVSGKHDTGSERTTNNEQRITSVEVCTDSQYVKKGMTEWIDGWIARGWKGSTKKPVLNQDLWEELKYEEDRLKKSGIKIIWKYVKAHCGIVLNERADGIATMLADGHNIELYRGDRENYPINF